MHDWGDPTLSGPPDMFDLLNDDRESVMNHTDDIHDWFASAFTVRLAYPSGDGPGNLAALWRCKVCAVLVEGEWRAAHRYWHLSSREVDQ